jgi:uncharacterized circularly permuted ATP-grasp superfamily protein
MQLRDAIAHYHDLLSADGCTEETHQALTAAMRARRLFFGERPICTVLRPHFYTPDGWEYMRAETETLLGAFERAHRACLEDADLRAQLYLEPYEEALYPIETGYQAPWNTSRLDSFYEARDRRLKFVEYNAETPAGMGYIDQLSEAFLGLPIFAHFTARYALRSFTTMRSLLSTILDAYRQFSGKANAPAPQIAIVDWQEVPTLNEHHIIAEFFAAYGVPARLADPRALELRDGALWHGDYRVDLIYKRVLSSELVERMGLENPVVQAVRSRVVCMVNAFAAKLMAKKASFALLSDERNAALFTDGQRAAIEAHIPWTRIVGDRAANFHGQRVDMLPFLSGQRENMVLKPNDEYGGKGVIIGWETAQETWDAALRTALTEPYVAQERVMAAYEDYPAYVDGRLQFGQRLIDADPYVFHGKVVSGGMSRLSSMALLNVTAGGGSVVPTFIIEAL